MQGANVSGLMPAFSLIDSLPMNGTTRIPATLILMW